MGRMDANAPAVSPPPSLLLPFHQYLLQRLKSENVELLKRIFTEFLQEPQRLTTVQSMLQMSFPVVALLPIGVENASARAQADVILSCMKCVREEDVRRAKLAFEELHESLSHTIELKNWDWLAQIFEEFCHGEEDCLVEFVRLQRQAISIIPVAPPLAVKYPSPTVPTGRSLLSPVSSPSCEEYSSDSSRMGLHRRVVKVHTSKRKVRPLRVQLEHEEDPDVPSYSRLTAPIKRTRLEILREIRKIEDSKPWTAIFDVSRIEYPFDADEYPDLAHNLKWFWRTHAQAVWERPFWYPIGETEDISYERGRRQDRAANAFIARVMVPAYTLFGPQFFMDLDNGTEQFYWWWYRRPFVNIMSMGNALGLEKCLMYLHANATKRFPDQPKGFRVRAEKHCAQALSMWSVHVTEKKMRTAIERLKMKGKTRAHAHSSEEDMEDY